MFRVTFCHLSEQTKDEFEYEHLMDALKVAKETQLSDRLHSPAISDEVFDEQLGFLITTGFIYAGRKTPEHPDGDVMVMLQRVSDNGHVLPVHPAIPMPRQLMEENNVAFIPLQHNHSSGAPVMPPVDESRSDG